jgi:predicted CopG family antitoxin
MKKYATISVPEEVKKILQEAKGRVEWGDFLLKLYEEARRRRGEEAFKRLAETLTEDELKGLIESSREFGERFVLR